MAILDLALKLNPATNKYQSNWNPHPLRAEYFVPARMPMNLVFPRPDGETNSYARHRNFHSQMKYEIPIGIQGGAWPFKYEILTAPSGATIGQYYGTTNYGVISWTPTGQTGSQSFSVRVTDCDGSAVTVNWTATLNDAHFIFVNPNAASSGSGTISSPLKLWSDWYLNDHNNSTYASKTLVLRGGNHVLVGASGTTPDVYNVQIDAATKPTAIIEFPNETAIIDCSAGKILIQNCNDFYASGCTYNEACQLVDNAHYFFLTHNNNNRATFHRTRMDNFDQGLVGTDNANGIFVAGTVSIKNYLLVNECTFNNFTVLNNGGFIDMYDLSNFLIHGCVFSNSNVSLGVHAKATVAFGTMRANDFFTGITGVCMAIGYSSASNALPHDHEMCWNKFKNTGTVATFRCVELEGYPAQTYNTYAYRNTSYGGCPVIRFKGVENFGIDANLVVSTTALSPAWDMTISDVVIPNLVTTTLTAVDSNLIPTDPTKQFFVGCEVYR